MTLIDQKDTDNVILEKEITERENKQLFVLKMYMKDIMKRK